MRIGWIVAMLVATPAAANVVASSDTGFHVEQKITVAAPPARAWAALVDVGGWWDPAHSYSGQAANLSIDPRAGGCWCEKLGDGGSVEHMRVIFAQPGKLIRFSGGLGPLQDMAVAGVLSVAIEPSGTGSTMTLRYKVSGTPGLGALAPIVDGVLAGQMARLKKTADAR